MRSLLLSDLRLALPALLDDDAERLAQTHAGRLYAPRLALKREAIEALPPPVVAEGRLLVDELARADAEHDGFGAAIWHYTEAVRLAPGVSRQARAAARLIREVFIPELALLTRSYATEAAHALGKRERIAAHEDALATLPVPGSRTLRAWVEGFVSRGERIEALMRARAERTAAAVGERDRTAAGTLRVETIGLLGRLRAALADELADDPAHHARLDADLFGYIDQLAAARNESLERRATARATSPAPAPEAPTSTDATAPADPPAAVA
jgi:hypothetical protein